MKGSFLKVLIEFLWCFFLVLQIFSFLSLLSFLFVKDLFVTKSFCLVLIDAEFVLVCPWPQHVSTVRVHRLHCMSPWNVAIFSLTLFSSSFFSSSFVYVLYTLSLLFCVQFLCVCIIIQNNHILSVFCNVAIVIYKHVS